MASFDVSVMLRFMSQGEDKLKSAQNALRQLSEGYRKDLEHFNRHAARLSEMHRRWLDDANKAALRGQQILGQGTREAMARSLMAAGVDGSMLSRLQSAYMAAGQSAGQAFTRGLMGALHAAHNQIGRSMQFTTTVAGSMLLGGGVMKGVEGVTDDSTQRTMVDILNLSPAHRDNLFKASEALSLKYRMLSKAGLLEIGRDAIGNLKDPAEAEGVMEQMAKSAQALALVYKDTSKGLEAARQFYRGADIMGMADNPAELKMVLEAMTRQTIASGRDINPQMVATSIANLGSAKFGMGSNILGDLVGLNESVRGQTANYLRTFNENLTRANLANKDKARLEQSGLRLPGAGAVNSRLLQEDPFEYVMQMLKPRLEALGVNFNSDDRAAKAAQIREGLNKLGFQRTGGNYAEFALMQEDQIRRDRAKLAKIKFEDEYLQNLANVDLKSGFSALESGWKDAWAAMLRPLTPTIAGFMTTLSNALKGMSTESASPFSRMVAGAVTAGLGVAYFAASNAAAVAMSGAAIAHMRAAAMLAAAGRANMAGNAAGALMAGGGALGFLRRFGGAALKIGGGLAIAAAADYIYPGAGMIVSLLMMRSQIMSVARWILGIGSASAAASGGVMRLVGIISRLGLVGALVGGGLLAIAYWDQLIAKASQFGTMIQNAWAKSELKPMWDRAAAAYDSLMNKVRDGLQKAAAEWEKFGRAGEAMGWIMRQMSEGLNAWRTGDWSNFFGTWEAFMSRAERFVNVVLNPIKSFQDLWGGAGPKGLEGQQKNLTDAVRPDLPSWRKAAERVPDAPSKPTGPAGPGQPASADPAAGRVAAAAAAIEGGAQKAAGSIKAGGDDIVAALQSVAQAIRSAIGSIGPVGSAARGALNDAGAPAQ